MTIIDITFFLNHLIHACTYNNTWKFRVMLVSMMTGAYHHRIKCLLGRNPCCRVLDLKFPSPRLHKILTFGYAFYFGLKSYVFLEIKLVCVHPEVRADVLLVHVNRKFRGWREVTEGRHLFAGFDDGGLGH